MADQMIGRASRTWHAGMALGLISLAAFYLAPAVGTGYWAEELYQSIMPRGSTVLEGNGPRDAAMNHVKHTLLMGRFFPLTPALITTVHYWIDDVRWYKAYIVATSLVDLALFYFLVARLTGRRGFAGFATCVTIGLIQYRVAIDPSLGFFGQMQWLIAGLFVALLTLRRSLDTRAWWWHAASVTIYLGCCLLYEVAYALVPLPLCLIAAAPERWGRKVCLAMPYLVVVLACGVETAFLRWLHPSEGYWQQASFDAMAVTRGVIDQVSAGLPLSYFLADPLAIFPDRPFGLARWLMTGGVALVALVAFGLALLSLKAKEAEGERPGWVLPMAIGAILAVFPSFLIAISPYHRANIGFGVGWIPALISTYGVGLLLAGWLWLTVKATIAGGADATWKCVVAAFLVAMLMGITYRANREVVHCFDAARGSKAFREEVARAGGGRHVQRQLLEAALGAGLLDDVPAGARLQLAHEYPYWYDATYARYFFAAYAGKAFETLPPSADRGRNEPNAYRVRDALIGRDGGGYVVLSHHSGTRIYVRDPGSRLRPPTEKITTVRSGPDWAIYSLDGPTRSFPADSLRVRFGRGPSVSFARASSSTDTPTRR